MYLGGFRVVTLHRVPPAGFEGGVFRGDGFGDEYSRRICWSGDEYGGEEGGGGEKSCSLIPN